jgi:uncharacterized protein YjiS (DUF1127 family)
MIVLLSSLLRERQAITHREILSLSHLDDHLLRDIGLRRTDLYAVPVERLHPAAARAQGAFGPSSSAAFAASSPPNPWPAANPDQGACHDLA